MAGKMKNQNAFLEELKIITRILNRKTLSYDESEPVPRNINFAVSKIVIKLSDEKISFFIKDLLIYILRKLCYVGKNTHPKVKVSNCKLFTRIMLKCELKIQIISV